MATPPATKYVLYHSLSPLGTLRAGVVQAQPVGRPLLFGGLYLHADQMHDPLAQVERRFGRVGDADSVGRAATERRTLIDAGGGNEISTISRAYD